MKWTQPITITAAFAALFSLLVATNLLFAAWSVPSGGPSESTNTPTPLNVGPDNQTKAGDITAANLRATNQIWSTEYCDEAGQNCAPVPKLTSGGFVIIGADTAGGGDPSLVTVSGYSTCALTKNDIKKRGGWRYNYGGGCEVKSTDTSIGEWTLRAIARKNVTTYCNAVCK